MSDEQTVTNDGRKISVSFSRKVSDGNYGTIEASAWVQGDAPEGATTGDVALLLGDLFTAASAAVFDQLGITYEMSDDGVLREKQQPTVHAAQQAVERAFGPTSDAPTDDTVRIMNPADSTGPLPDWIVRECNKLGISAVWDNRSKATGKQPHFKEAVPRGGTGHGKDGEPKAFWPPR